ncbi:CLUMA_CG018665, isoform A [Clunio marinus]|uniref:CLUMA_CG018665, isoform A n=1 Tax=Clunio marinus TaxID=568069 RepID=A0A1J1J0U3_9DIPT|nr:CLUMA_CG018665, isoform A [Clunio marinus]
MADYSYIIFVGFVLSALILLFIMKKLGWCADHGRQSLNEDPEMGTSGGQIQTISAPTLDRVVSVPMAYDDIHIHSIPIASARDPNSTTTEELPPSYNEAVQKF